VIQKSGDSSRIPFSRFGERISQKTISPNPKLALLGGIDEFGWWDRPPNNCCCCCNRRVPRYLPDLNWSYFHFVN
jgi:hypothetical protein